MIPMALFKKFLRKQFIAGVEVSNIARCSSKTNELRDIDSIGCRTRNICKSKNATLVLIDQSMCKELIFPEIHYHLSELS